MSFDGIFTHAMAQELNGILSGGRVAKIQQPYENEVVITIRAGRKNHPLLLSANPQYARVQITHIPFTNPDVPATFTMTLRKYFNAATLTAVHQVQNDRVLHFEFSTRDELGDELGLRLIIEMMGRHSNIFLVSKRTGKIIELIRHVSADQNRYRPLMPGAPYVEPPKQDKINPFDDPDRLYHELERQVTPTLSRAALLQQHYQGLAKDSAAELALRLNQGDAGWDGFFKELEAPAPTITTQGKKAVFTAIPYQSLSGDQQHYPTLSTMLDAYYEQKAEHDCVLQQGGNLIHVIKNVIDKDRKKQRKLKRTLEETEKADDYRIRGEILTTYLSQVQRGMTSIELPNFYADNQPIKITLSNQLTPSRNAQKYFAKYTKLRNAVTHVNQQMQENQEELDYLEGIMAQINVASPKDLADIRLELQQQGYLRKQKQKKGNKHQKVSKPDQFYASDGTKIWVGKNNLQNDQLTLHTAKKTDIWLHVKDIPGSHVIIDSSKPSEKTLLEAAKLAAYFSKARESANVPVDWIEVKKIRKPNGAKPGFVVYEGQKTVSVTPDAELVDKLRTLPTK
ncbi:MULTISPECIES: NFACT RNA binding domain-containing protein [Lacticaseibacillus]|nr:NFACT RNA binding domain-containing protein [Lacticaseibacillus casei]MBI6596972.1 NFACT family protein [Lacticaseibacillus casei]MBO1480477.1 NFACT family protein [Lacticaseibacillus casei]MBO2415713.1 NFACT family protein [Lacticaseibacillus casei]MCK2080128.1 NFACT family protein [Lacticaseibacillus casei]MDZ5495926.1 NFACT RNA binding domain-containing protein [Lacticaseibacillus casei]